MPRSHRGVSRQSQAGICLLLAGLVLLMAPSLARGATIAVEPATPMGSNGFPFGRGSMGWNPYIAFVYKNVPAFNLKAGDVLAFDLQVPNDVDIQLSIALATTTVNGGDVNAVPFSQVVLNSVLPANPTGNSTFGDYELQFPTQAGYSFPGGGLIIRFSDPAGAFFSDSTPGNINGAMASATDASGFFVERAVNDADGHSPWSGVVTANLIGFRVILQDPPAPPTVTPVTPTTTTPKRKRKCKKRKGAAAAKKKCKKRKK